MGSPSEALWQMCRSLVKAGVMAGVDTRTPWTDRQRAAGERAGKSSAAGETEGKSSAAARPHSTGVLLLLRSTG